MRGVPIKTMMGVIACCAVVFAIVHATITSKFPQYVASAASTVTVTLMAAATVVSIARSGRTRLTWAGFAVFGWAYLLMCGKNSYGSAFPFLVTDILISDISNQIRFFMAPSMDRTPLDMIGHAVAAILFGLLGAALARSLAGRPAR